MSKELSPNTIQPKLRLGVIKNGWIEDIFKPSGDKKAHPYSIVIPPPNVSVNSPWSR